MWHYLQVSLSIIHNFRNKFFHLDKLTTTTTTNPTQQLRTATAYLSNQTTSTSQAQQMPQQIRQLFTNANNNSQTTNTQRLTEAAQRSPSSVRIRTFSQENPFVFLFNLDSTNSCFSCSLPFWTSSKCSYSYLYTRNESTNGYCRYNNYYKSSANTYTINNKFNL